MRYEVNAVMLLVCMDQQELLQSENSQVSCQSGRQVLGRAGHGWKFKFGGRAIAFCGFCSIGGSAFDRSGTSIEFRSTATQQVARARDSGAHRVGQEGQQATQQLATH